MQTISKMQIERYFADMLDAKDVVRILAESVGKPTETAIEALIQSCNTDVYPMLWVTRREGTPVGIVRLDSLDRMRCIITHIAVDCRGQGIGRSWPRNPRRLLGIEPTTPKSSRASLRTWANATGRRLASSTQSGVTSAAGTTVMLRSSGNRFLGSELI